MRTIRLRVSVNAVDQCAHLGVGHSGLIGEEDDGALAVIREVVQGDRQGGRLAGGVVGVPDEAALRRQHEGSFDLLRVVSRHDHDLADTGGGERVDRVLGERPAAIGDDLLRASEAAARSGRQDDPRDHEARSAAEESREEAA